MSTDNVKDKQAHASRALATAKASARIKPTIEIDFSAETEMSDETLEAVAGGMVTHSDSEQIPTDQG